jgi:hypothetical protein
MQVKLNVKMGITKKHYQTIFKKEDYKGKTNNRDNLIFLAFDCLSVIVLGF